MRTLAAVLLLAVACATEDPGAAPSTTALVVTTSTVTTSMSTLASTTTQPTTTVITVPASIDLINPMAETLAGVPVGQGPVEPLIATLTSAYGEPTQDTGWAPNECFGQAVLRILVWDQFSVYLEQSPEEDETVLGYVVAAGTDPSETIELPDGITLGMPYADAATLYPDGAYHHESLELDGVVLQESPIALIAAASADGSAPIDEIWVGAIPTCH